jgi:glycosyltransferase-like protein
MTRPLRIAVLAHSTLPRGGVVHAMNLCEALTALGVAAELHAPDAGGAGFFRACACPAHPFPVAPAPRDVADMVERRIADYRDWLRRDENRGYDVYHAHDAISGNALATLNADGAIAGFVRTVHHIDAFADPRLDAWQTRAIREASRLLVVSDMWRERLRAEFARGAEVVGNGVDLDKFTPRRDARENRLRARWRLGDGPIFLAVGGLEARKNTLNMLAAFASLSCERPDARFVIAGGASLLDHGAYQSQCRAALAALPHANAVVEIGPVDDAEMPALYRLASALTFASTKEGFGLCVLEAMACGTPVVVSRIAPFVEYLGAEDALFCDPLEPASIAAAMREALLPETAERLCARGLALAARHSWRAVAERSLRSYRALRESAHA